MRPLFPFYGAKWRDARRYPLPRAHVIEPFAGSAGFSLWHEPARVTLIDIDPIIVGVWHYLIGASESDVLNLPDVEVGQDVRDLGLSQEATWLIGFWLNRGSAQPKRRRTAYSARTDRAQLIWGERARQRIAADLHKIRHWRVWQGDYTLAPDDPEGTTFVDPPYITKGRHYRFSAVDHDALGLWCQGRSGDVIACEQKGAAWLPFRELATVKSTRGVSDEVIWTQKRGK